MAFSSVKKAGLQEKYLIETIQIFSKNALCCTVQLPK